MRQFNSVVKETIPGIAVDYLPEEDGGWDNSWSQEEALAKLLKRLASDDKSKKEEQIGKKADRPLRRGFSHAISDPWRPIWTLSAASILLCAALGILVYQVGLFHSERGVSIAMRTGASSSRSLALKLADADRELEASRAQLTQRNAVVADLRRSLQRQGAEISRLKGDEQRLELALGAAASNEQTLIQERSGFARKLEALESQSQLLQEKLGSTLDQASGETVKVTKLQDQVNELKQLLDARSKTVDEQEELLAHDRDIRELMGARDLYIAEVYDVDRNGETRKSFGRVFYTKGKSLVFYAYDLEQRASMENANTFQAWGMRGADKQHALSLGIFYEDNASKKRWVLKTSDSKLLEQVDAVFVTLEPSGGSHKPSTSPLLFAYLRIEPNHP